MKLSEKLQLPPKAGVFVLNAPRDLKFDFRILKKVEDRTTVLLFATSAAVLEKLGKPVIDSAKDDQLSWVAYPKAGKLETDLNRDKLVQLLKPHGIEGVRLVSIDDTWSAMRFRPIRNR